MLSSKEEQHIAALVELVREGSMSWAAGHRKETT